MSGAETTLVSNDEKSTITLTFLDPLVRSIGGLKYQIAKGKEVFIHGVSNEKGECRPFTSEIGALLTVEVACFGSDQMKAIKSFTPSQRKFSAKLISGKIKETIILRDATGEPGPYRRKVRLVEPGANFDSIPNGSGTIGEAIAQDGASRKPQRTEAHVTNLRPDPLVGNNSLIPIRAVGRPHPTDSTTVPAAALTATPNTGGRLISSVEPERVEERGSNGTPKTTLSMTCTKSSCITVGMSGALIEEVNIRLTGFGGSVKTGAGIDKFTTDTESAIRNFQRDYMHVPDTGKICGDVLTALDQFRIRFPVSIEEMKCRCGTCGGFGQSLMNSETVNIYGGRGEIIKGVEFPGIHRGLAWLFRAALFYTAVTDKTLGYTFLKISSGYRCWNDNKINRRKTYNHMGNALDLQFSQGNSTMRCTGLMLDTLREKIFIKRLGAKIGWSHPHHASLESAKDGATAWVHVDVREFGERYKLDRHYAATHSLLDGHPLVNLARQGGELALLNCGGIPQR
jgi:hypothetical protein